MRFLSVLPLILACAVRLAASDAVDDFDKAMAGDDFQSKRTAIRAVAGLPKDQDEKVLDLLVRAIGDRQGSETALEAIRARTGLSRPVGRLQQGSGYPNYPATDDVAGWGSWVAGWKKDQEQKKKLSDVEKKAKDLEKKTKDLEKKGKDKKEGKDGDKDGEAKPDSGEQAKPGDKPRIPIVEGEKGPRCRIHFKNGGSKLYYLLAKRSDADGNLISVRVAYMDGGGTEVLTADAIARIEEDVK